MYILSNIYIWTLPVSHVITSRNCISTMHIIGYDSPSGIFIASVFSNNYSGIIAAYYMRSTIITHITNYATDRVSVFSRDYLTGIITTYDITAVIALEYHTAYMSLIHIYLSIRRTKISASFYNSAAHVLPDNSAYIIQSTGCLYLRCMDDAAFERTIFYKPPVIGSHDTGNSLNVYTSSLLFLFHSTFHMQVPHGSGQYSYKCKMISPFVFKIHIPDGMPVAIQSP